MTAVSVPPKSRAFMDERTPTSGEVFCSKSSYTDDVDGVWSREYRLLLDDLDMPNVSVRRLQSLFHNGRDQEVDAGTPIACWQCKFIRNLTIYLWKDWT